MAALLDCDALTDLETIDPSLVITVSVVAGVIPQGTINVPAIKATWSSGAAWFDNPYILGVQFEYGPADLSYGPRTTTPQGKSLLSWADTAGIVAGSYTYRYRAVSVQGTYGPWSSPATLTVVSPNFAWGATVDQGTLAAAIGNVPPNASVGGLGNINFVKNQNNVGAVDAGEIRITGDTLYTDMRRSVPQNAVYTFFEGAGAIGRFYLIQGATSNTTRFPGFGVGTGGVGTMFCAVYNWVSGQWSAMDNAGSLYPFALLDTDIIVAVGYRASTTSAGIDTLQSFINTNTNLPEDGATVSRVFRQSGTPVGAVLNDIWVVLVGTTPTEVRAFNGTTWVSGADMTLLNIAAGIIGQGPGATDQRDPDLIGKDFPFAAKVSVTEFPASEWAAGRLTRSGFNISVPPGDIQLTGRVRLTRTASSPYIQLNMAAFGYPGGVIGRDLTSVQGNFRPGTSGAPIASQWRGLCRAYSASFSGGFKDITANFPVNKDGSTSMGSRYKVCEFDWYGDDEYEQALITAIRVYPVPNSAGDGVVDLGWISAGSRVPEALRLRGVADGADPTALNIASGIIGQANAATDTTIAPGAGGIDYAAATTARAPSYYRAFGPIVRHEQKSRATVGVPGSGTQYGVLTTRVTTISTTYPMVQVFQFDGGVYQRQSTSESAWGAWNKGYDQQNKPFFGADILESAGGVTAALENFKTILGISSGFAGQGALSTLDKIKASQSALGDTANSFVDPDIADQGTYIRGNAFSDGKWSFGSNAYTAGKNLALIGTGEDHTSTVSILTPPTPVGEGEIGWYGAAGGSFGSGANCIARFGIRFYDNDDGTGSYLTTQDIWTDSSTNGRNVVKGKLLQPPSGARSFRFYFARDPVSGSTDRALFATPIFLRTMRDSRMASRGISSQALMSVSPPSPFTPSNSGGARIVISPFTITGDWLGGTGYNGATITGLAYNTLYYIWVLDPIWGGGSVTYVATTSASTYVNNPAYIFLGPCKTLNNAGGGGTIDPEDPRCVHVDMVMHDGRRAAEVEAGDDLLLLTDAGDGSRIGQVEAVRIDSAPCIHIETESGAWIVVSERTPLTGVDGGVIDASEARPGRLIGVFDGRVSDGGVRWEPITKVRPVGHKLVAHISADSGTYAAGGEAGRLIFTHNIQWKP